MNIFWLFSHCVVCYWFYDNKLSDGQTQWITWHLWREIEIILRWDRSSNWWSRGEKADKGEARLGKWVHEEGWLANYAFPLATAKLHGRVILARHGHTWQQRGSPAAEPGTCPEKSGEQRPAGGKSPSPTPARRGGTCQRQSQGARPVGKWTGIMPSALLRLAAGCAPGHKGGRAWRGTPVRWTIQTKAMAGGPAEAWGSSGFVAAL